MLFKLHLHIKNDGDVRPMRFSENNDLIIRIWQENQTIDKYLTLVSIPAQGGKAGINEEKDESVGDTYLLHVSCRFPLSGKAEQVTPHSSLLDCDRIS